MSRFFFLVIAGCGASMPTPAQHADVLDYTDEQRACVIASKTREEADACRTSVRVEHGRAPDGGAP